MRATAAGFCLVFGVCLACMQFDGTVPWWVGFVSGALLMGSALLLGGDRK